jgi:hypothetical protein
MLLKLGKEKLKRVILKKFFEFLISAVRPPNIIHKVSEGRNETSEADCAFLSDSSRLFQV